MPARALTHPATYTAWAIEERNGPLKKDTVEWKDPAEGEIVIKVLACGICAT